MQMKIEEANHSPIYVRTEFRTRLHCAETWTGVRIIPYGWGGWADDPTPAETASDTEQAKRQPNRATRRRAARDARRHRRYSTHDV